MVTGSKTPAPQETAARETAAPRSEGQRLYDLGDYKACAAWYDQALQNQPRNAGHHYNMGNALFKEGQTGRAIAAFLRAFDIDPRDADVRQTGVHAPAGRRGIGTRGRSALYIPHLSFF